LAYTVTSARSWPGFPITGTAPIFAGGASFDVDVAIPDTAALGVHELRMTTAPVGEAAADSCAWLLNVSTAPTPPTIVATCPPSVQWIPGGEAHGQFYATVSGTPSSEVEFTLVSTRAWPGFPVSGTTAVHGGVGTFGLSLTIPDSVAAGTNALRITFRPVGESVVDSCAWILSGPGADEAPGAEFTVAISPNPASGPLTLRLRLQHDTTVRAEIRQLIAGRVVFSHSYGRLPSGSYAFTFVPDASLPPGVYTVRTYLDGYTRDTKLVVVR